MKKILVTGSTSGIGKEITKHCLHLGMSVVGLARDHSKVSDLNEHYFPYLIDFSKTDGLEQRFKTIAKEHTDITAMICCSGYGHFVELEQFSYENMRAMLDVNFLSQALLVKTFLPQLKKGRDAKIIFLGSECALEGQKKGTMYCAAKFALRGFAKSLRQECRSKGVAVTIINPGMVRTPFFEKLRFKPGEDVSHAILPDQVAQIVLSTLMMQNNCVMAEINCEPMQKFLVHLPAMK